jgi:hypothetical protein
MPWRSTDFPFGMTIGGITRRRMMSISPEASGESVTRVGEGGLEQDSSRSQGAPGFTPSLTCSEPSGVY